MKTDQYDRDLDGLIFSWDCFEADILDGDRDLPRLPAKHLKSNADGTAAQTTWPDEDRIHISPKYCRRDGE